MSKRATRGKLKASKVKSPVMVDCNNVTFTAAPGEGGEKKQPTFEILAYTGGLFKPYYPYWPVPVVVDLAGIKAAEPVAVLLDHYQGAIVGQSTKVAISQGTQGGISLEGIVTGDTENPDDPAHKVVLHARNGFKWKASVGISDERYERVEAGQTVAVNGREFAGPCYVMRAGTLVEVSLLSVGADKNAGAKVAAGSAGEMEMDFHDWLKAKGFDPADLKDKQRDALLKIFKAEQGGEETPAGDDPPTGDTPPASGKRKSGAKGGSTRTVIGGDDPFAHIKHEESRKSSLQAAAVKFATENPTLVEEVQQLLAAAIAESTTEEMFDLQLFRVRGQSVAPDNRLRASNDPAADPSTRDKIFEAGLCLAGGLANIEKHFEPRIVEAADKRWRHRLGLGEFLLHAGRTHGFSGLSHRDVDPLLRAAFPPAGVRAAGPSTMDVSGILSNVANKFIVDHFNAVDSTIRRISGRRTVTDFKQITSYSLSGDFTYIKVAPGGELKHGTLGETPYTNQADTYGRMFAIDRRDIINDDLGAFMAINKRLGRGGALALNDIGWALFMNNTGFFTAGRLNYDEGADTALGLDSLTAAEALFLTQKDPDGKPLGLMPAILLTPAALKRRAMQLMNSTEIRQQDTSATVSFGTNNTFQGAYRVESTPYLQNAAFTGYSALKWYLLANPDDMAVLELAFLNGVDRPTVESAQADFNVLGIQLRGFFDFGFGLQEYRAGVAMKGEV